jgi:hypothetical protein
MNGDAGHLLVDPATPDGSSSGLHGSSLVACPNLFTVEQSSVMRTIGSLTPEAMLKIDRCVSFVLGIAP